MKKINFDLIIAIIDREIRETILEAADFIRNNEDESALNALQYARTLKQQKQLLAELEENH